MGTRHDRVGPWERTGDYQGCGPNREAKEERISNFGDVDVQWVPAPNPIRPAPGRIPATIKVAAPTEKRSRRERTNAAGRRLGG